MAGVILSGCIIATGGLLRKAFAGCMRRNFPAAVR